MKIKTLNRYDEEYIRETKRDLSKQKRNMNSKINLFEKEREYTRALNAIKLDRIFSKPFVFSFNNHKDSILKLAANPIMLTLIVSGSCDGEIRCWELTKRYCVWKVKAHDGFVRGLCVESSGKRLLSCGDDKSIRIWDLHVDKYIDNNNNISNHNKVTIKPIVCFFSKSRFTDLTCSFNKKSHCFATSGAQIDLWLETRSKPIHSFLWSSETMRGVRFNPIEYSILCSWSSDRKFVIYDTRVKLATNYLILKNQINDVSWNPREAYSLTLGASDYNAYTFDIRNLRKAKKIHIGHVQDVECISYSPTGREFATGSYDCTVRIFNVNEGKSREIYYSNRMQRVKSICFSADNRFILSGSDDTNIRVWKANSSKPLNKLKPSEEQKLNYYDQLKKLFRYMPEINRIAKYRHIPRWISKKVKEGHIQRQSKRRKVIHRRNHSKLSKNISSAKRKPILNYKH